MWVHQAIRYFYMLLRDHGDKNVYVEFDGERISFELWNCEIKVEGFDLIITIKKETSNEQAKKTSNELSKNPGIEPPKGSTDAR